MSLRRLDLTAEEPASLVPTAAAAPKIEKGVTAARLVTPFPAAQRLRPGMPAPRPLISWATKLMSAPEVGVVRAI